MAQPGLTRVQYLQGTSSAPATANGNGVSVDADGVNSVINIEVAETNGGTCTLAIQGSLDGKTWYAVGYQRIDNQSSLARAVANLSVTANLAAVYQVLDAYPQYRAVISSIAGSANVTVRAYTVA